MKRVTLLLILFFLLLNSCIDKEANEKQTARKYCGSCHAFPDPSLLPKSIWEKNILPQMAFRMGLDYFMINQIPEEDQKAVYSTLPANPLVTKDEWEIIKNYYAKNAPDSLELIRPSINDTLKTFNKKKIKFSTQHSMITLVSYDSEIQTLFAGTRKSQLWGIHNKDSSKNSIALKSPISFYKRIGDQTYSSLMGNMDPNDQKNGILQVKKLNKTITLIDSLKRPVHFEITDLNNDKLDDILVCEFGNYLGELSLYKNLGGEKYQKVSLISSPGARKVEVMDWNKDGTKDIIVLMTQGDERIVLLKNAGGFNFSPVTLAKFPSVYGSSYFEIHDLNKDGYPDIIYSNGDNGDYSMILKPYHGLRTLLNNSHGQLKETWFYPMHGASQFRACDFDNDGDLDIAAISFFPDFKNAPEKAFVYFESVNGQFKPQIINEASAGRWLTMECADINNDGFVDIVLGALNFTEGVPSSLSKKWKENPLDLLILENRGKR